MHFLNLKDNLRHLSCVSNRWHRLYDLSAKEAVVSSEKVASVFGLSFRQGKLISDVEHQGDEVGEDDKDRITAPHDLNNPELPSPRIREATTEPDGSYYSYEAAKAGSKTT